MLMAVGIALVVTWVFWKCWRILKDQNVNFHSHQLKFHGKINRNGIIFLLIGVLFTVFTIHSTAIQSFKFLGDYAMAKNNTKTAMHFYRLASPISDGGYAIASNPNVDNEVAHYFDSQLRHKDAERFFRRIDRRVGSDEESTTLLGRNLQFHEQFQAIDGLYVSRLTENPKWVFVWEEYIGWLRRDGIYDRAIEMSTVAVQKNPTSKRLRIQLVLLESEFGDQDVAVFNAQTLIENYREDPAMWMLYARALDSAGRRNDAQKAIETANQIQLELLRTHELD
jgi:tetratricopeptide (TPR) repeat protein